ncbi:MAG TPA: hypothetical protein VFM30_05265 [Steroidobacteraceae bacterium]|jgi:hypothetical protein|nr:hypothetical protein [Steroidobacteraceae bacterium]
MSFLKHPGLRALGTASVAAFALAACGGTGSANDELPLIHANITIKSVSQGGVCDTIPVRINPKQLKGQANKYANNRLMVKDVPMSGPTDEAGAPMCNGAAETLPLAPGDWEFSAPLASGTTTCVRDIQPDGDRNITFIDGAPGCGGPESAMPVDPMAPADGTMPPADGTEPPPPAG